MMKNIQVSQQDRSDLPDAISFTNYSVIAAALLLILCLLKSNTGQAAVITQTLGHQAFPDGTKVGTATFAAAHAGIDPFPFDGTFLGSDVSGPNLSANWTFSYGAISDPIASATLALGIYDCDSAASGNQVASFLLNGSTDLTVPLNAAFEANPSQTGFVNDYTITLPAAALSQLATGSAGFSLALQAPGLGVLGETVFNGGALDFSTISITTQSVPEPASVILLGVGAVILLRLGRVGHLGQDCQRFRIRNQ
jgi:hypothetical protein